MIFFNGSVVMRILSEEAVGGVIMKYMRIFCFFLFWLLHHSLWFDSGLILTFLVWRRAGFNRPYDNPSTDYTSLNFWSLFQTELSSSPSSLLKKSNLCENASQQLVPCVLRSSVGSIPPHCTGQALTKPCLQHYSVYSTGNHPFLCRCSVYG